MGIQGLSKLIADLAPAAITDREIKSFFSRRVAIDASMSLYQFLIAVRSEGSQLTTADGESTSHLSGMFYRTVRMVENGIKPVYVFDGKPPKLKAGELELRSGRRQEAEAALEKAIDEGDEQEADKQSRRVVRVSQEHVLETRRLLDLMGIPHITAPSEAEAQCAELVRGGKVFAVGTEDMDALTFGADILLRHLTFSEARKMQVKEYHLDKVLEGLRMSMEQFVDLCILLGCDYCEKIRGLGPKSAVKLVQEYKSIERILEKVDRKKHSVPENWPFREARALFQSPEVTPSAQIELRWSKPDEDGLVKFLCEEKGFNEERIRRGAAKLMSARNGTVQVRIDSFFKVMPKSGSVTSKRKSDGEEGKGRKKFKKTDKD